MKIRTLLLLLLLAGIIAFAALNWSELSASTTLSLGVTTVDAPLGLVMLGLLAAVTAFFLVFLVYLQTTVLLETRRHARELQANRTLADQAEASRFTELRQFIEAELRSLASRDDAARSALMTRIDQLERTLHASMEESGNALAAYIGELDDRLQHDDGRPRAIVPTRREH